MNSDKNFQKLEKDVKETTKEIKKMKDTMLLMSHKVIGIADWKVTVGREFHKINKKVDILFKEHEKAEQEVVAEILRPDDL